MERRFYLGAGLLVVVLLLGLLTGALMENCQTPAAEILEQAAQTEDLQAAVAMAQQAKELWQARWKKVASVADHTPMDEIDSLFAELDVYARAGEQVHFAACCSQLASLMRAVSDAHALNWWNVL